MNRSRRHRSKGVQARLVVTLLTLAWLMLLAASGVLRRERAPAFSTTAGPAIGSALDPADAARISYPANGLPTILLPDGERRVVRSVLNVTRPMRYGDFEWNEDGVPPGPVWIRIDLKRQMLSVFRAGHEIGTAVVLYGTDHHPTPTGTFHVLEMAKAHWSNSYNAPMPFMLRLTDDGVAIHASDVQKGFATHGCIGVPPDFASRLFEQVHPGDLVAIAAGTALPADNVGPA